MKIIVDTNRIIAALIKDSASRKIILSGKVELLTAEFVRGELQNHKKEVRNKVHIKESDLDALLSKFFKRIYVVEDIALKERFEAAKATMDKIDPDDTPLIALALAVENDGIWSDDKHFAMQKAIRILNTADMLELLE